jgi:hypothetical protein
MNEYHVLNGDALKDHFPESLQGELIVFRECLVDGPVSGSLLSEFYQNRSNYLIDQYPNIELDYFKDIVTEFEKITQLNSNTAINLWFEDDLFCQVNFWFLCHLIIDHSKIDKAFFISPKNNLTYGFSGLSQKELEVAFENRVLLSKSELRLFASLWVHYQKEDHGRLIEIAQPLYTNFPFLKETIKANKERFPENGNIGRPEKSLLRIIREIGSEEFGPVFQKFHNQESIYGFGDLQVKKIFDKLTSSK